MHAYTHTYSAVHILSWCDSVRMLLASMLRMSARPSSVSALAKRRGPVTGVNGTQLCTK